MKSNEWKEIAQYQACRADKLEEQIAKLEKKLKAILCIECEKDLLECTCDTIDTQLNL